MQALYTLCLETRRKTSIHSQQRTW